MLRWQNNISSLNSSKFKLYGDFLERNFKKHCQICCVGSKQYHADESRKLPGGHGVCIAGTLQRHFKYKPTNHAPKHHVTSISSVLSRQRGLLHSSLQHKRSFSSSSVICASPLNEYTYPFTGLHDLSHTTSLDNLAVLGKNISDISLSNQDGIPATEVLSPFLANMVDGHDVLILPTISKYTEALLYYMHDLPGMPWWTTIFMAGFLARLLFMLPTKMLEDVNMHKVKNIMEDEKIKNLARSTASELSHVARKEMWTEKHFNKQLGQKLKPHLNAEYRRDWCHPRLGLVTIIPSILPWIAISHAVRNIVSRGKDPLLEFHSDYLSLNQGGLAWFTDLTLTDTTMVLPLIVGSMHLLNIELNQATHSGPRPFPYSMLPILARGGAVCSIGITGFFPAAVGVFWLSSAASMALVNVTMMYSPYRRLVGLPKSSWETCTPFRTLGSGVKVKYYDKWSDGFYQMLGPMMGSRRNTDILTKTFIVLGFGSFIGLFINNAFFFNPSSWR